jgi:ABC-type cobalamin/Fe3+-siderophores transport system ATPase subunit
MILPVREDVVLSIERFSFRYRPKGNLVLDSISLDIRGGEVVALAGPNGSGKSTLLRGAGGMLAPLDGAVRVNRGGSPIHRLNPEQRARLTAAVPQFAQLPPGFTVQDVVMAGRISFHGWFGSESPADRGTVAAALADVGLAEAGQEPVETLSGGAQQRVLIARALAQEAPVLLMDEPTAHLDLRFQVDALELLRRFAREGGRAILVAMHDLNLAARYCDRIALLDQGRLVACGAPEEVLSAERLSSIYSVPITVIRDPVHGCPLVLPNGAGRRPADGTD